MVLRPVPIENEAVVIPRLRCVDDINETRPRIGGYEVACQHATEAKLVSVTLLLLMTDVENPFPPRVVEDTERSLIRFAGSRYERIGVRATSIVVRRRDETVSTRLHSSPASPKTHARGPPDFRHGPPQSRLDPVGLIRHELPV